MSLISKRKEIKAKILFISGIKVDIEMMLTNSNDLVKEALKKLKDIVAYSDPISNKMVEVEEQLIMDGINELKKLYMENNVTAILEQCKRLEDLFVMRNKKLIITK